MCMKLFELRPFKVGRHLLKGVHFTLINIFKFAMFLKSDIYSQYTMIVQPDLLFR